MNETQFTTEELYELRLACMWSKIYWEKKQEGLPSDDPTRETHRSITRGYSDLWQRVDGVITAQESALMAVNG